MSFSLEVCQRCDGIEWPAVLYIPSEFNSADGPSRGLPVGTAPETSHAHSQQLSSSVQQVLSLAKGAEIKEAKDVAEPLANSQAVAGYERG